MSDSHINHPLGARFVMTYVWAAVALGKDAAAVLGLFDFLDRAQEKTGQFVASRTRVLAELEGVLTQYAVDNALRSLTDLGFLIKRERDEFRKKNMTKTHEYALDAGAVNLFLEIQNADVSNPERRRFENQTGSRSGKPNRSPVPDSGTVASPESGTSTRVKDVNVEEDTDTERAQGECDACLRSFLEAYPQHRRGNESEVAKTFAVLAIDDQQAAAKSAGQWSKSPEWKKEGGRWVPFAVKFLTERRWTFKPASSSHCNLNDDDKWKGYSGLIGKRLGDVIGKTTSA